MNMTTRLKRGAIGALVALLVFGAGAFAQTADDDSVPVTLSTVTGQRMLQLTGADTGAGTLGGPVLLGFGTAGTAAPFGAVVTDLLYPNTGYDVYAELSNLYPVASDGTVNCSTDGISSANLWISDQTMVTDLANVSNVLTDVDARLESTLQLAGQITGTDLVLGSLGSTLGVSLTGPLPIAVSDVGLVDSVRETFGSSVDGVLDGLTLMNTTATPTTAQDGAFEVPAVHPAPGCGATGGGSDPSKVYLQAGDPNTNPLGTLPQAIFDEAGDTDGVLTAAEAVTAGLLPDNALVPPSGSLWSATRTAVEEALLTELGSFLSSTVDLDDLVDLDATTTNVIGSLTADVIGDLDLSLIGQSGVYPSIQVLNVDRSSFSGTGTGIYHGVMTVTLVNDPAL